MTATVSRAQVVTDLINGINDALQAGDIAAFNANLNELVDVSPEDARDVMRIIGHLVVLSDKPVRQETDELTSSTHQVVLS